MSLSGQMYFIMTTMVTYQVPITLSVLQWPRTRTQTWWLYKVNVVLILCEKITRVFVPGILLEANLFGDGKRENDQDCSNNDGELAVSVPVAFCTLWSMSYRIYHWNKTQEWRYKLWEAQIRDSKMYRVRIAIVEINCRRLYTWKRLSKVDN